VNARLQLLRQELRSDAETFALRIAELTALPLAATTDDLNLLARAAVALHHGYGAAESAMARLAKTFGTEPTGGNWPRALLESMALPVPGVRPAILSPVVLPLLRDLLSFRHFFRHAYAVPLDAVRLGALRDLALRVAPLWAADMQRADEWLAALAAGS
jgi:hypothetical protein